MGCRRSRCFASAWRTRITKPLTTGCARLEERLRTIFGIEATDRARHLTAAACGAFTRPILATGRLYEDTIPVLRTLREQGVASAIVSNTCWGSPGDLWRVQLAEFGLDSAVDHAVFCTDVGWRKPDRRIFDRALALLDLPPRQCLFVGDHRRWDVGGALSVGMDAILIDRDGAPSSGGIADLWPLLDLA